MTMIKIETRIKNKERLIRKTSEKVGRIERQISGLEEERLFCSTYEEDAISAGCLRIRIDPDKYKNWGAWRFSVGGNNEDGSAFHTSLFSEFFLHTDSGEIEVGLIGERVKYFEKYYPQMYSELIGDLEKAKRRLSMRYEEYGRLIYQAKGTEYCDGQRGPTI